MKELQDLRKAVGLSRTAMAAKLGIAPSAITAWERGSCHPSPATLRDLALLFGSSMEEIFYFQQGATDVPTVLRHDDVKSEYEFDCFTGHIGVMLAGREQYTWYPVTHREYENFSFRANDGRGTYSLETLNNRVVVLWMEHVKDVWFEPHLAPGAEKPWGVNPDCEAGASQELYNTVFAYFQLMLDFQTKSVARLVPVMSPRFLQALKALIASRAITRLNYREWCKFSRVATTDGGTRWTDLPIEQLRRIEQQHSVSCSNNDNLGRPIAESTRPVAAIEYPRSRCKAEQVLAELRACLVRAETLDHV